MNNHKPHLDKIKPSIAIRDDCAGVIIATIKLPNPPINIGIIIKGVINIPWKVRLGLIK